MLLRLWSVERALFYFSLPFYDQLCCTCELNPRSYKKYNSTIYYGSGANRFHNYSINTIANEIIRIVEKEGPIHLNQIKKRITEVFNVRLGLKIEERINQSVRLAEYKKSISSLEFFYLSPSATKIYLRHHFNSDDKRAIEEIPNIEIELAIRYILENCLSISENDLISETARLFGHRATNSVKYYIETILRHLIKNEKVSSSNGRVKLA